MSGRFGHSETPALRWLRWCVIAACVWALGGGAVSAPGPVAAAPAIQVGCTPRPQVNLHVTNTGTDVLNVWVSVSQMPGGPPNAIQAIRFATARNARIDVPNGPSGSTGSFEQQYPPGTVQTSFTVRRDGGVMHVPFTVVDTCGEWPTFVGGGMGVGQPPPPPPPSYPHPGTRLYALAHGSPDLVVIDTTTNQVVTIVRYVPDADLTFRDWPATNYTGRDLLVHPSGRFVYLTYREATVPLVGPDVLVVIDTATNQVIRRFVMTGVNCGMPFEMLLSPDGGRLVLLCSTPHVLDTAALDRVEPLPNPGNTSGGVFDVTGRYLFVPTTSGVAKIDLVARQHVRSVDLGGGGRVVYDPTRNRVYSSPGAWALDGTTLDPLPLGSGGRLNPASADLIALSFDGSRAVEARKGVQPPLVYVDGSVDVFDATTGAPAAAFPLAAELVPTGLAVHPTQQRMYLTVDVSTGSVPPSQEMGVVDLTTYAPYFRFVEHRRGVLGFSPSGDRVYLGLDFGIAIHHAQTLAHLGTVPTTDGAGRNLSRMSSVVQPSTHRMYVGLRDRPDGAYGPGGVMVFDTETAQMVTLIPIFDIWSVALLP